MNKPTMGAPRGRDVFADLERAKDVISDAPAPAAPLNVAEHQGTEVTTPMRQPEQLPTRVQGGTLDMNAIRAMKPRKEPTIQTNVRLPVSLIDDIDLIRRLTGTSATEIITDVTRREVARLKKLHGID
jgi:hypothetical protein